MAVYTATEVFAELGVASPQSNDTTRMSSAITAALAAVQNYIGYPIESASYTEYYPIARQRTAGEEFLDVRNDRVTIGRTGDRGLILKKRPVRLASLAVYEQFGAMAGQSSGAFPAGSLLTLGSDYWLDLDDGGNYSRSGILFRYAGTWSPEPGSIKVVYTAGYTSDELSTGFAYAVKSALLNEIMRRYRQKVVNGVSPVLGFVPGQITSESMGGYAVGVGGNVQEVANVIGLSNSSMRELQPFRVMGGKFA